MAYIYQADILCDACGQDIRDSKGKEPDHEYDSDEYPTWCDGEQEADSPQHCGSGDQCLCAEVLSDGTRIGFFLGNDLTTDGVEYVRDAVNRDLARGDAATVAREIWQQAYTYIDFEE